MSVITAALLSFNKLNTADTKQPESPCVSIVRHSSWSNFYFFSILFLNSKQEMSSDTKCIQCVAVNSGNCSRIYSGVAAEFADSIHSRKQADRLLELHGRDSLSCKIEYQLEVIEAKETGTEKKGNEWEKVMRVRKPVQINEAVGVLPLQITGYIKRRSSSENQDTDFIICFICMKSSATIGLENSQGSSTVDLFNHKPILAMFLQQLLFCTRTTAFIALPGPLQAGK